MNNENYRMNLKRFKGGYGVRLTDGNKSQIRVVKYTVCTYMLIDTHTEAYFIQSADGSQKQCPSIDNFIQNPDIGFRNISQHEEQELLDKMTNSRAREGIVQDEPGTAYCSKKVRENNGDMSE